MNPFSEVVKQMGDYLERELNEAERDRSADNDSAFLNMMVEPERMRVIIQNLRWLEREFGKD